MISLGLTIILGKGSYRSTNLVQKTFNKYKSFEIERVIHWPTLLDFSFYKTQRKMNHAGWGLTLIILGNGVEISFRDIRHWDSKADTWQSA